MTGARRVRRASELILGHHGPEVIVSARAAAFLLRYAALDQYHREHRGEDAEIDETLVALKTAALIWRNTETGTMNAARPELLLHNQNGSALNKQLMLSR